MCELLVRVKDKINTQSQYLDSQCLKRGDVVVICEDNHPWSDIELSNPEWRIIKFPNIPSSKMESFVSPQIEKDPINPSNLLQRRAIKIDLDNFPTDVKSKLEDDTRVEDKITSTISVAEISTIKTLTPYLVDNDVFSLEIKP